MAIEGPLKELDLNAVFQLLDLGRKTGELRITSSLRQNEGRVFFEQGAVCAAAMRSNPHPLGACLLRAGKISEAELAHARGLQEAGDERRLGDILVDIGAIGRRELERQVRAQVEEVVFELVSWSEGYFSFVEGPLDRRALEAPLRIPTEALLMEAARRIDEWSRIERTIPHLGVVPRLGAPDGGAGGQLDLEPSEWEVLAMIDGARDVRTLADGMGRSEFDVARTLFGLASTGVIVLHDPLRTPPAPASAEFAALAARAEEQLLLGDPDSARAAAEALVASFPDQPEAHVLLGRALHAAESHADALAAFQEALRRDPLHAAARRLLGISQVALGRFDAALSAWEHWALLPARSADEEALAETVARLREAAQTLARAVRERHA